MPTKGVCEMHRREPSAIIVNHAYIALSDMRSDHPGQPYIEAMGALVAVDVRHPDGRLEAVIIPFQGTVGKAGRLLRGTSDDDQVVRLCDLGLPQTEEFQRLAQEANGELMTALARAGRPDRMTPDELSFALTRMSLTRISAVALLGVTTRTIARWLNDEQVVPEPAARLLRVIVTAEEHRYSWDLIDQLPQIDPAMTVDELKILFDVFEWPTAKAADVLGTSERSIQNWRSGARKIPAVVARIMRIIADLGPYRIEFCELLEQAGSPMPHPPLLVGPA